MQISTNGYGASPVFLKKDKPAGNNLNIGVVSPPDKLPNASLYASTYGAKQPAYKQSEKGSKLNAGKLSAMFAFGTMALSLLSLFPFIRKR